MQREPNTEYVLSLSYGKDSLACLGAIEELGWPLDRITHAEVWATDDIPADLPPMVQFKAKADEIIRERYGIEVEHQCAVRNGEKLTYEKLFYHIPARKKKTLDRFGEGGGGISDCRVPTPPRSMVQQQTQTPKSATGSRSRSAHGARNSKTGLILGFPIIKGPWCTSDLKRRVFTQLPCTRSRNKYCAVPWHSC